MSFLKTVFLFLLLALSFSSYADDVVSPPLSPKLDNQTWSNYLQFIEGNTVEKDQIFHQEMQKTNASYAITKNRKSIESFLKLKLGLKQTLQTAPLNPTTQLTLIDNGLGRSTDLVKISGVTSTVLYSNFQIKKNNSIHFSGFSLSPYNDYVVIFFEKNGSLDDYSAVILDLNQNTEIPNTLTLKGSGSANITWISKSSFYSVNTDNQGQIVDLKISAQATSANGVRYWGTYPRNIECDSSDLVSFVDATQAISRKIILNDLQCDWISRTVYINHIDFLVKDPDHDEQIKAIRYRIGPHDTSSAPIDLFSLSNQVFDKAYSVDGKYIAQTHWGKTQSLFIFDQNTGQQIDQVILPDYASVASVKSAVANTSLSISLTTPVSESKWHEYNYINRAWTITPTPEVDLVSSEKLSYVTQVFDVPGRDGVLIPVRLTYLKTTTLNENTPALFKVYGGYSEADFYPANDFIIRHLFINHGGVLITAGVRGGNEFGTSWHTQAAETNRMTTFYDVISVAEYLIAQKWTSKNKLILTGTSAGGLVTLASGMLAPNDFGLLIPISGPFDVVGKIRLDSRFFESQETEYGNPAKPEVTEYMKKYSPLEQTFDPQTMPSIFIIAGLDDSRVNVEHSLKMIKKLRLSGIDDSKMSALLINNSGHWLMSEDYQNIIAWRAKSVMWNKIYGFLNWDFSSSQ